MKTTNYVIVILGYQKDLFFISEMAMLAYPGKLNKGNITLCISQNV